MQILNRFINIEIRIGEITYPYLCAYKSQYKCTMEFSAKYTPCNYGTIFKRGDFMNYENNKKMTAKSNSLIIFTVESGSHKITFDNQSGNVVFNSELDKLHFLNQ